MKSQYLTKLWLEDLDGEYFIVCAPFEYYSELLDMTIVVPIEFETNFASIPMPFRMIWPRSGKHNKADVLHDAGYNNKLRNKFEASIKLDKSTCDSIFNEAMELSGVNGFQRRMMYRMVSLFGRKK